MKFTSHQLQCIEFCEEVDSRPMNLVIEAGAGAGKTAVLAQRVIWNICDAPSRHRLSPHEITLATFTRAAEKELRERVHHQLSDRMPGAAQSLHISTIDSLLMSLFDSLYAGFWFEAFGEHRTCSPPAVQLVDEAETLLEIEREIPRILEKITFGQNPRERAVVIDFILAGAFKGSGTSEIARSLDARKEIAKFLLSEACLLLSSPPPEIIQKSVHCGVGLIFEELRELARSAHVNRLRSGRITHTDRLVFLHNIYCAQTQQRIGTIFERFEPAPYLSFKEIIVDEYQDTNPAQHDLLVTLSQMIGARMIVVGDPKQSLYAFRRAKVEVFRSLSEDRQWRRIILADNYRSEARLLRELNTLARLALTYEDPTVPKEFWQSPHGQAARRSQVEAMDLRPGRDNEAHDSLAAITILTHSTDKDRLLEEQSSILSESGIAYPDLSAERIVFAVEHLLNAGLKPSECAILCETNRDCDEITIILRAAGYAVHRSSNSNRRSQQNHILRSCLVLLELITGHYGQLRAETTSLGLFDLFTSPIFGFSFRAATLLAHTLRSQLSPSSSVRPEEISRHFEKTIKILSEELSEEMKNLLVSLFTKNQLDQDSLSELADLQQLASHQPLGAWLSLAHRIAKSSGYPFPHSPYEAWALTFSEKLESTGLWCQQVQTGPSQMRFAEDTPILSLLPESLTHSESRVQNIETSTGESFQCLTVHGAKGLQWNAVIFFPKSRPNHGAKSFRCLQLGDRNVVQWFDNQGALELFSRVSPQVIENKATLIEYLQNYSLRTPARETDPEKFMELTHQEKSEQLFERARVFYTAITRAKKHLVLLTGFGTANQRKSVRDLLAKLKPDSTNEAFHRELSDLIKYSVGAYLDRHFNLRSYPPEGKKRGARPLEPWHETEEIVVYDQCEGPNPIQYPLVRLIDAAAPSLKNRAVRALELKNKNDAQSIRHAPGSGPANPIEGSKTKDRIETKHQWTEFWQWHTMPSVISSGKNERPLPSDDATRSRFERVQEGILVHAEEELGIRSYDHDPVSKLRRASKHIHTEWEVWTPIVFVPEQPLALPSPSRNIVDLICVCSKASLPDAFQYAPIFRFDPTSELETENTDQSLETHFQLARFEDLDDDALIWVVVDYKTGKTSPEHQTQMMRYLNALAPLSLGPRTGSGHLIGCLAYLDRDSAPLPQWRLQFSISAEKSQSSRL